LEITEFDTISREIKSKYDEHEEVRLSRRKRGIGAGRLFNLKVKERFLMLLVYIIDCT
jgi:hypothetical protein